MKQEPEPQPGLWGPGQPEPRGPGRPPPTPPFSLWCSLPFSEAWGRGRLFIKPASLPCLPAPPPTLPPPTLPPPPPTLVLAAMSLAEQGELGGRAGGRMSSGDVSHPIPSSPTRPCGLAGRAHSRTPHTAHPGAHAWDRHIHSAHVVPQDPAHTTNAHSAVLVT